MIGILASLSWASPQWLAVSAGLGLLAAGALAWGYGRRRAWRGVGAAAALTKALAIGLLALALMEPVWASKRPKAGENLIAVVVDNSQGMRMRDTDGDSPRSRKLRDAVVGEEAGWLEQLAETFKVRRYLFDENLSHTLRFEKLDFSGRSSSLDATLRTLQQRYRNRPLAGIVLLTDGIATDTVSDQTLKNSVPIHAVPVGSDHPPVDVAIGRADLSQTPFEDAPVTCRVRLETSGCAGHKVAVELRSSDGLIVQSRTHLLQADDPSPSFRFRFRPPRPGVLFYEVSVRLLGEEAPAEATGANNRRTVVVDRGGGPYRVLYVTGRPNWEFKFLRRALSEDEQVNLVGLVRIAKKEPKFSWQGRRGETANPLFRGFDKDKKDERTEQYDQPVLIRLGTEDKKELAEGFPKTAEALFAYHGLIIDDLESGFFSRDQMELIQQFVADRAGGLLMLGG
ncbi:MAG: hypothetical protein R3236_00395, partial [Phycisphaeraceae bacterium]|nr:hypothetical protein [Phycisphaeraceae bacterium]